MCSVKGFTLPSGVACYCHTLRPPVGPMRNPILNQMVIRISWEVLANLKRVAQCSCLSSCGLRNGRSKYCIRRTIVALHLPRKCRLISCSSSHRGHEASLCFLNRARCRFNVLHVCPVKRPISILTSLRDSRKAYFKSRVNVYSVHEMKSVHIPCER